MQSFNQHDSGPSAVLKKDPIRDIYYAGHSQTVINHKPLTAETLQCYENADCQSLFPDFDPSTDFVGLNRRLEPPHLLHKRISPEEDSELPPPGLYRFDEHQGSAYIAPHSLPDHEDYVPLQNNVQLVQEDIELFFDNQSTYQDLGMQFSRGLLLWGPPGVGKSRTMMHALHQSIQEFDVRALYVPNQGMALRLLEPYRRLLKDIPTIVLFEEITQHTRRSGESLLSFLDGENTWENNYTVASTNYPEKLPRNIVDRPGRFDRVIHIPCPDKDDRREYLEAYLREDEVTEEVIQKTEDLSVGHLKELVLRSRLHNQSPQKTIQDFKSLKRKIDHAFDESEFTPGFVGQENGHS